MIALKTVDMRNNFKRVSEIAKQGEPVLIARPHNDNLVVLSEYAYNEMVRIKENAEYRAKIEKSLQELREGKVVVKTMEELEAMAE
ncbi:MAG: type II toxin-antitoxin system Phd/YefM family antitoxin [Clostridiales Family XIII bacterium]|jgi:antitoxin YefM|nr:type II toxin-antitoxin system Phd/YefM family antitoxin [Clostridiales Family XIII bacterium]